MERKFESELAGQVARRQKGPIKGRAKVLFMTLVSCAVMVAGAAAVLSMDAGAADGAPTEYASVFANEDYLVNVDGLTTYTAIPPVDNNFLVKRNSELKWTTFDTPGNSPVDYTKVAYTVNVKLRDISSFASGVTGMVLTDLDICGFGTVEPTMVSASIAVNDYQVLNLDATPLASSAYISTVYFEGVMSVSVKLPSLDGTSFAGYADDDVVSIFVMFKVTEPGLTITGSEIGFPDYQPALEPL